jgi:hypothetical protein
LTDGSLPNTTLAVTLTVTAGNALVVAAGAAAVGSNTLTIADDRGGSYGSPIASISQGFVPPTAYLWVAPSAAGGVTTVTVTAASSDYLSLVVSEVSGLAASPVDQSGTNMNQANPNPPTVTTGGATTQASELVYAFHNGSFGGGPEVWTATAGFTIPTNGSLRDSVAEYKIVSATGTYTSSPQQSLAPGGAQSIIGTFKASASSSVVLGASL